MRRGGWRFRLARGIGKSLPFALLVAYGWARGLVRLAIDVVIRRGPAPPHALPGDGAQLPAGGTPINARIAMRMTTLAVTWSDDFATPRWRGRFDTAQLERLRPILDDRPVIVATLHYGAILLLPSLLRAHGIRAASAVSRQHWPVGARRERLSGLTRIDELPLHFGSGDVAGMLDFLRPGRCLMASPDYPFGDQVAVVRGTTQLRLSIGPLRLARLAGAAVVPTLLAVDGPWRFSLHVGRPVPDEMIVRRDHEAAAAHMASELMPLIARRPEHSHPTLVAAFAAAHAG